MLSFCFRLVPIITGLISAVGKKAEDAGRRRWFMRNAGVKGVEKKRSYVVGAVFTYLQR